MFAGAGGFGTECPGGTGLRDYDDLVVGSVEELGELRAAK